jgi:hypothetical protein
MYKFTLPRIYILQHNYILDALQVIDPGSYGLSDVVKVL